ncbi:SCY1-like protein 2 [Tribolium castaneum]|uniref:SCY1-like protein 2 n=1 Tax=Tribolium castaneum TaxID=7070 RepID=UPI0000D577FE|nr:PREDICTED: SCY1-like protein 2 [Tribolium castaneum]|eukprot:XP_969159.1 PREDICTED: SCY1-like protein 2 [Tribolium castaneum]
MEVFNKLYSQVSSSVSSTVSQLSGVLPGNPVTREFDASTHIASAGPGLVWKIYKGCKRSTKQEASIFVFEKRQLEKWGKADREMILESLKRGVSQLTKIRHPQVLTVQHPLEESRESLAFATEPVFASLANVLGKTTNMPQPANMSDYKLYDIEIKYGLLQVSEGLAFLHNDVKLLHRNIAPESIIINNQGVWKIFGFDFCVHNTNPANLPPVYPCEGFGPTLPDICRSNLEYLAPECVLNQTNSPASDMFSVGVLAYVLNSTGNQALAPVRDLQQFRARAQQLKNLNAGKLQCIPEAIRDYVKLLLSVAPEARPDAHQFIKIPYFDDVGIKTLTYLDSLLQWDNLQKSQFYKGLPEALPKLPQRVKVQRVLTCLSRDLAQPAMVPFILPSILDIAQDCTKEEYCLYVLPHLKPVMKLMEPIQILLIMLQRMELLLKLTPPEDVQQHVLPMLYRGLDSDIPQVHELCLSILPTFANLLDHSSVKNSLLPRIKRLCLSTSSLSVRVNCLLCVGRLLEHLDKWLVLDEILPFLPQIPSREPAVLMGILGIYKLAMNHKKLGISKEVMATRILPFLMPLCIENGLTLTQFNALVTLVKEMFQLVETEHRSKLEQLNTVKDEQKVLTATMPTFQPTTKPPELDQAFSGLGLDSFVSVPEKPNVTPPPENFKPFQNQAALEPVKRVTTPPKDLTSSLFADWSNANATSGGGNKWAAPQPQLNFNSPTSSWGVARASQPNWGVLDNLLPTGPSGNTPNKIPMNQMGARQPLIPTMGAPSPNNNTLSKDEIMDLLS